MALAEDVEGIAAIPPVPFCTRNEHFIEYAYFSTHFGNFDKHDIRIKLRQ